MKLSYRGTEYTITYPQIETIEIDVECSFLGNTTKLRVPKHMPSQSLPHQLKYRGNSYHS